MRCLCIILLIVIHTYLVWGATWYVRPGVHSTWNATSPAHPIPTAGVYGSQNGTDWANAWNGLESIVWGSGGVTNGDTLYICGGHIYTLSNYNYTSLQADIPIDPSGSGCTIRMDYAPDPGLIFGGAFDRVKSYPWEGPDANGVYRSTNWWNDPYSIYWQVTGTNIVRLNTTNTDTWVGGLGTWSRVGNSNFIKTSTGDAPTTNIALNAHGWKLTLPDGLSNVVFESCTFIGGGIYKQDVTYPLGNVPVNYLANHITFRRCNLTSTDASRAATSIIAPQPGNDYWTFDGCEIAYGPAAIYSGVGNQSSTNQTRGVIGMVVTNCYLHDLDTANYPAIDGHAIGAQDNSDCVFVGNRIERSGTAIALFSYGYVMTNNIIASNYIKDVHWYNGSGKTGGEGIWISAQTNVAAGNRIIGNIILNTGLPGTGAWESWMGSGISCSLPNKIVIVNNTSMNTDKGIYITVNLMPVNAEIFNNIIVNPTNVIIRATGLGEGTVSCDYNLYLTNSYLANPFTFDAGVSHDEHSIAADPLFIVSNPSSSKDFRLNPSSPAINSGTNVGLPYCQSAPDMGAFEFCNQLLLNTLKANNVRISP